MKGSKLDSPLKYSHLLKVTLRPHQSFPLDMLRYDNCHPHNEIDSSAIEDTLCGPSSVPRVIIVEKYSTAAVPDWTLDRWRSFGKPDVSIVTRNEVPEIRREAETMMGQIATDR